MCGKNENRLRRRKRIRHIVRRAFSKRAMQGSVTIFLLIIMLPMLVFSFSVMDLCKIFMAKSLQESSADLALNAALTSYDAVLKDMYGIMATSSSEKELTDKITKYYVATLESSGFSIDDEEDVHKLLADIFRSSTGVSEDLANNDSLLKVTASDIKGKSSSVQARPVEISAVSNPVIMHRQIVEYMKLRAPAYLVSGMLEKVNAFGDMNNQVEATNAKVTFEQTLSDINNECIEAYTLFDIYFYNNDRLETGSSSLTIPYLNEQTKNITKYRYTGNRFPFKLAGNLGGLYWNGKIEMDTAVAELEWAVRNAMVYGDYVDCFQNGTSAVPADDIADKLDCDTDSKRNTHKSYTQLSNNLSIAYAALIGVKSDYDIDVFESEFKEKIDKYLGAVNGYSVYKKENISSYEDFIAKINRQDDFNSGVNMLLEFAPLFKDVPYVGNDFTKASKDFINAFYEAKQQYNNDINDEDADLEALEALDDVLSETEIALRKLKYAIGEVQKLVNSAHSTSVTHYDYIKTTYNQVMTAMCKQIDIIDRLTGSSGLLDSIYEEFKKAQEDAGKYSAAVGKIETDSVKTSFNAQYVNEASDIKELDINDVTELKNMLIAQRQVYVDAKNSLMSLELFGKPLFTSNNCKLSDNGTINGITAKFDNLLHSYKNGRGSDWRYTNVEGLKILCGGEGAVTADIGAWNASPRTASDFKSNRIYQKIVELAAPRTAAKDDSMKNEVENQAESSSSAEKAVELSKEANGEKTDDVSKEDASSDDDFDPDLYQRFSEYIKAVEDYTVAAGDQSKASLSDGMQMGDDDKGTSSNAMSMMSGVSSMFTGLATAARDDFYITEYLTHNFSCHTTNKLDPKKAEKMINGQLFYADGKANVVWYGAEMEYILYGLDSKDANVAAAGAVIFAIRFVLNLIYSFTDSEITAFTQAAAAAAGALLPFAIPLIQVVIHIGLALAESAYDLMTLMDGGAVPIYKTTDTWVCKGSSIVRNVAKDVVSKVSDTVIDKTSEALINKLDDASEKITKESAKSIEGFSEWVDEEMDNIQSQVKSDIIMPMETVIRKIMPDHNMIKAEDIKALLDETLAGMADYIASTEGPIGEIEKPVYEYACSHTTEIASKIKSGLSDLVNTNMSSENSETIAKTITSKIENMLSNVISKIKKQKTKVFSAVEDKVADAITATFDEAKNMVDVTAADIKSGIKNKLNQSIRGHVDYDINYKEKGSATNSAMLSMTYKEYLYLFTLLGLAFNETNMLERTAQLMCANCRKTNGEPTTGFLLAGTEAALGAAAAGQATGGYDINKACTLIELEAGATVRTIFLGTTWSSETNGWICPASNKYSYTITAYAGY